MPYLLFCSHYLSASLPHPTLTLKSHNLYNDIFQSFICLDLCAAIIQLPTHSTHHIQQPPAPSCCPVLPFTANFSLLPMSPTLFLQDLASGYSYCGLFISCLISKGDRETIQGSPSDQGLTSYQILIKAPFSSSSILSSSL